MACYMGVNMSVMIEILTRSGNNLTAVEDLCIQVNNTHRRICFSLIRTGLKDFTKSLVCSQKPRVSMEDSAQERISYILQDFIDADSQVDKEDGLKKE